MHLVGFIIRIYHDARSSECQARKSVPDTHWTEYCVGFGNTVHLLAKENSSVPIANQILVIRTVSSQFKSIFIL